MSDFKILKSQIGGYVILAPQRANRPDESESFMSVCPFCIGNESKDKEIFRIGGNIGDTDWLIRVLNNKFPFAPIHEVIIHSPDHHKSFDELPLQQVQIIFEAFRLRYNENISKGTVFIFSNHGEHAGESLPHPHSQLVVLGNDISFIIPPPIQPDGETFDTDFFTIYSPLTSQWPDEVWVKPKSLNMTFGQINNDELVNLSYIMQRLIQIFSYKHGHEFPYNFYIYPGENWYLRFIPREKKLGGLEIVSNVFINTGDPIETIGFIKDNFVKK